jgi:hypothetical protein
MKPRKVYSGCWRSFLCKCLVLGTGIYELYGFKAIGALENTKREAREYLYLSNIWYFTRPAILVVSRCISVKNIW